MRWFCDFRDRETTRLRNLRLYTSAHPSIQPSVRPSHSPGMVIWRVCKYPPSKCTRLIARDTSQIYGWRGGRHSLPSRRLAKKRLPPHAKAGAAPPPSRARCAPPPGRLGPAPACGGSPSAGTGRDQELEQWRWGAGGEFGVGEAAVGPAACPAAAPAPCSAWRTATRSPAPHSCYGPCQVLKTVHEGNTMECVNGP